MITIHNSATNTETAVYGDFKERAKADCAYMNRTELKYGRPEIYSVVDDKAPKLPQVVVEVPFDEAAAPPGLEAVVPHCPMNQICGK